MSLPRSKINKFLNQIIENGGKFQFHPKTAKRLNDLGYIENIIETDGLFRFTFQILTDKGYDFLENRLKE